MRMAPLVYKSGVRMVPTDCEKGMRMGLYFVMEE